MIRQKSRPDPAAPADYGDPCGEAAAVHASAGLFALSDRLVFLKGADAANFLHTLSSNDIKSLAPGRGAESLFLTARGKIRMPFTAWAFPGHVAVQIAGDLLDSFVSLIESSVVMEDVALDEQPDAPRMFHLAGPAHAEVLKSLSLPDFLLSSSPLEGEEAPVRRSVVSERDILIFSRDRTVERGVDIAVPESRADEWHAAARSAVEKFGGRLCGAIAEDILRIEAGIPKFGVDYTADHLPQEASREEIAVSFTKGCYTGQEVVARINTYGGVNRRLVGLVSDGPPACPGDPVFRDGKPADREVQSPTLQSQKIPGGNFLHGALGAGSVTSAARSIKFSRAVALALVSKGSFDPGTRLRIGSPDGPAAVVVDIARQGSLASAAASKIA
ncbi:hypothetical protein HY522_04860 [bacterium]|nr:hypothetical protein [bacterium]